jgi:hypothetical protein
MGVDMYFHGLNVAEARRYKIVAATCAAFPRLIVARRSRGARERGARPRLRP